MDTLSHGLWAVAVGKGATLECDTTLKGRWLLFWGMFPDLFAFVPVMIYSFVGLFFGIPFPFRPPTPGVVEPWTPGLDSLLDVTQLLYSMSHSIVIFFCVIGAFYILRRSIPWIALGWPLHILADIPTHSQDFFATPVFWPLSDMTFNGFVWGHSLFTLYNYVALIAVYTILFIYTKYILKRSTRRLFTW